MRVLIVDDNPSIHSDFQKILTRPPPTALDDLEAELFGATTETRTPASYELSHAHQGEEAVAAVRAALDAGQPYSLAFVDIRMPPGIDGVEAVRRMWKVDPELEVVICSAYSDFGLVDMQNVLGDGDRWLVLRKPFDTIEIERSTAALVGKRALRREANRKMLELESAIAERTASLEQQQKARLALEAELRHAQKLEAVGQLAAGVAHEINTPVQFVGDSVHFLREAFDDMRSMIESARTLAAECGKAAELTKSLEVFREAEEDADLEFLLEEIPQAFERTRDGVDRVAAIVKAMRGFAHTADQRADADINQCILDTITVSRNEYKLVADLETDLATLPSISCFPSDLNQVFLNLIVNAAHAIEEKHGPCGSRGTISIRSRVLRDHVEVEVVDDGTGIDPEITDRIFDPFFTTKPVGKGTGQGLAISHAIVVDKHRGTIDCESERGRGTTFRVRIPMEEAA